MDEIAAATGGPQYNVLRKLEARGWRIRKVKEGRATRYFTTAPAEQAFEATLSSKGQLTLPKEIRDRLRLGTGATLRLTVQPNEAIVMTAGDVSVRRLKGILGKPPRSLTLAEMDEVVARAVVAKANRR